MFLFESKQEKTIRQDVEKNMQLCISNSKKYQQAKEALQTRLKGSDQKVIEMIVDNVKATIKNQDYLPIRKYQAMLLLKDLMSTHNKALGKYVVKKLLKRLKILAQHKSGVKDEKEEERGKDIFGKVKKDQQQYAIKFLNVLLTSLQSWGKSWPKAPDGPYKDFHREYNDLLMNGVQFPKQIPKEYQRSSLSAPKKKEEPRNISPTPPKQQPKKQSPKPKEAKDTSILNDLRGSLDKFYEDTRQPLELLASLLPSCDVESLPMVRDIITQISKNIQVGDQFIISIEGNANFKSDDLKLQKCFDFVKKIEKDMKILTKNSQQIQAFKNKYAKLSTQLLQTLAKDHASQLSLSKKQQTYNSLDKSKPSQRLASPEEPKIKNPNRYTSVQGNQVLQNFPKNVEYQSNSGQSAHSDRFGSFGGAATDRHRASIPIQHALSPQGNKNKEKPKSDRRAQKQGKKQITTIAQEKTFQLSKYANNQNQNQGSLIKPKLEQPKLSSQFVFSQKKQSQQGSSRQVPAFENNNSFGLEKFARNQEEQADEQDFFARVEQNEQHRQLSYNPRRKKNPHKEDNEDIFNPKLPSKIDSSKLSGFNFSQIEKLNNQIPKNQLGLAENPFGLNTSYHSQRQKQMQASQVVKYDPNKSNSQDFFKQSFVRQNKQARNPVENPFATGNFAHITTNKIESPSPFDKQSMKSKQSSPNENPFNNQSFEKMSRRSKEAHEKGSRKSIQNQNIANKRLQNPFDSNAFQVKNPFYDSRVSDNNNEPNPFETSTHKSNTSKNPFQQVKQFYKPPISIENRSERNSAKNIENENRNDFYVCNLGFSNMGEPVRDSLVLSARVDNNQQNGLNFSQFQDIAQPANKQSSLKNSNPFNLSGQHKENNQFSGFSLSNFPPINQQPDSNQKPAQLNLSAADFFANYQKDSVYSRKSQQQRSKRQNSKLQQQPTDFFGMYRQKNEKQIFDEYSLSQQNSNGSKKSKEVKSINKETQKQSSEKSFELDKLDKVSAIYQKPKGQQDFQALSLWGKVVNNKQKQADNKSQKELSWGDFDKEHSSKVNHSIKEQPQANINKSLQVYSKLKPTLQKKQNIRNSKESSIQLNIQDFAPISKKGIEWNPIGKFTSLKQQACICNIDDKKLQEKRNELIEKQKLYYQKLSKLRQARSQNQKIRGTYVQKMRRVEQLIQQKNQYQQILKRLKYVNSSKENKIEEIHQKTKKAIQVKQKILQKQKQLYDVTKNQVYSQENTVVTERNMSSKWQIFNKNLQHNRNSMYTLQSHYTSGY